MDPAAAGTSSSSSSSLSSSSSSPAAAARSGYGAVTAAAAVANARRQESGVALGLFSKIAAARKEKLGSMLGSLHPEPASSPEPVTYERRASTPLMSNPCPFPEIHHDNSAARISPAASRATASSARKTNSRSFVHNLRLYKQEELRSRGGSSGTTLPSARGATGPRNDTLRRSIAESSRSGINNRERILPIDDLGARPATAGDETLYGGVRGHVRRSLETTNSSSEYLGVRRPSEWTKPGTVDNRLQPSSSSFRGQPDILVLDSQPSKQASADPVQDTPEQEIVFTEKPDMPGVPIVSRHQKAKATNPERMNLDRRNLTVLPQLEGEQMLRLLNLQNNVIRRIDHLLGLPNLIFLDLYNNRIDKLENLHAVPSLRVLMLGKNRLKRIENLECLRKLDVLDLHSNEIERIENLNDLTELRVLNLGGNHIKVLENIDKLSLLTELNLRRNAIDRIGIIGRLPSLQRLFLSNNRLESLDGLEPLLQVASIIELRLDNNAVCDADPAEYRSRMIKSFPLLKHLDLKPLTDSERKEGMLFFSQARVAMKERQDLEDTQRHHTLSAIKTNWEQRDPYRGARPPREGSPDVEIRRNLTRRRSKNSAAKSDMDEPTPSSREDGTVHKNKNGFSEIEVYGDFRVLSIYGDALEALDSVKIHSQVHAIKFQYMNVEKIALVATSSTSANLKLFARLRRLTFIHNDIANFEQLAWLSSVGTRAEELVISHNSVSNRKLFRNFVASRLSNVGRLNGQEISAIEKQIGKQLFPKSLRPKPPEAIGAKDKEPSRPTRPGQTSAVVATRELILAAGDTGLKHTHVDDRWLRLLSAIVQETLEDMSQQDSYLSGCLDGL